MSALGRAPLPNALAFLNEHESTGLLAHFGGAQGVADIAEASHFLTAAFAGLTAIFALVGRREPEPVFYICAGAADCVGSPVYSGPASCPSCGSLCIAVDRRGVPVKAVSP